MDHTYIDEQQIAERYAMGRLAPEEAESFAVHSLTCTECLDRLELALILQRGLRRAAVREAERRALLARAGLMAWLARAGRSPRVGLALAALLLLVAVVPSGLLLRRVTELDAELARARVAPVPHAPPPGAGPGDIETVRGQLERERGATARERQERLALAQDFARLSRPQVNIPVLTLSPARAAGAGPAAEMVLPRAAGWALLAIDLEAPGGAHYRATLLGPDGASRWQGVDLTPDAQGTLALLLPSSLLAPGDTVLRLDLLSPRHAPTEAARFRLHIERR